MQGRFLSNGAGCNIVLDQGRSSISISSRRSFGSASLVTRRQSRGRGRSGSWSASRRCPEERLHLPQLDPVCPCEHLDLLLGLRRQPQQDPARVARMGRTREQIFADEALDQPRGAVGFDEQPIGQLPNRLRLRRRPFDREEGLIALRRQAGLARRLAEPEETAQIVPELGEEPVIGCTCIGVLRLIRRQFLGTSIAGLQPIVVRHFASGEGQPRRWYRVMPSDKSRRCEAARSQRAADRRGLGSAFPVAAGYAAYSAYQTFASRRPLSPSR